MQTAVFTGAAFGPAIGGFTAAWLGYRATFSISAAMLFTTMLIVALFVREVVSRSEQAASRASRAGERRRERWGWMVSPVMVSMLGVPFMVRFAQMGTRPVMPLYLQEFGGYADDRAASLSGWMFGRRGWRARSRRSPSDGGGTGWGTGGCCCGRRSGWGRCTCRWRSSDPRGS